MLIGFNTAYAADGDVIFHETFDACDGTGGNDGQWKGSIASNSMPESITGWTFNGQGAADRCVKLGATSKTGSAQTPSISFENGKTYTLIYRVGGWDGDNTQVKVELGSTTVTSSFAISSASFSVYTATLNPTGSAKVKFTAQANKKRFFIDDVMIVEGSKVNVTIASSGWSSMTTPVGLDFSGVEGLTAYKVSSVTASAVNLASVNEAAGATGLLLNGTGETTYSIPIKTTAAAVTSNELSAAYSATPADADKVYILKNGQFCLVNAGGSSVPAGKSYLLASKVPSSARELNLEFDDETTALTLVNSEKRTVNSDIYDLQGRKVANPTKGLYIVNGKKVIIK